MSGRGTGKRAGEKKKVRLCLFGWILLAVLVLAMIGRTRPGRRIGRALVAGAAAGRMTMTVIDYGTTPNVYGDSMLLQSGGESLLMDSGMADPTHRIKNYLKENGVDLQ